MASILHLMDSFDIYLTDATVWRRFLGILIGRKPAIPTQSFPFPRENRQSRFGRVVMVFQGVTFAFTLWKCLSCIILVSKLVLFSLFAAVNFPPFPVPEFSEHPAVPVFLLPASPSSYLAFTASFTYELLDLGVN